jgi:hypothetical protein
LMNGMKNPVPYVNAVPDLDPIALLNSISE